MLSDCGSVHLEIVRCPHEGLSTWRMWSVRMKACPLVGMLCPIEGLSALGALLVRLKSCPLLNAQKRNTEAITAGMDKLSPEYRNAYQHAGNDHGKAETAICLEDAGRY